MCFFKQGAIILIIEINIKFSQLAYTICDRYKTHISLKKSKVQNCPYFCPAPSVKIRFYLPSNKKLTFSSLYIYLLEEKKKWNYKLRTTTTETTLWMMGRLCMYTQQPQSQIVLVCCRQAVLFVYIFVQKSCGFDWFIPRQAAYRV